MEVQGITRLQMHSSEKWSIYEQFNLQLIITFKNENAINSMLELKRERGQQPYVCMDEGWYKSNIYTWNMCDIGVTKFFPMFKCCFFLKCAILRHNFKIQILLLTAVYC